MKIKRIENDKQKLIIIGLITSDEFCKQIVPILDYNVDLTIEIFSSFYKIVLKWCVDYYNKYAKSPKKHIQKIYNEHFEKATYPEEDLKLISDFLEHLSDVYEREENFNEQYVIDQAILYFRKSNLELLKKYIDHSLGQDNVEEAEVRIEQFRHIKKETSGIDIIDVVDGKNDVDEIVHGEGEKLFRMHGDYGEQLKDFLRGDLVAVSAPAKRGKSWHLLEFAIRALMCGLRVVLFSFEMPAGQCMRRIYQNICGEVKAISGEKEYRIVDIPYFSEVKEKKDLYEIKTKPRKKRGLRTAKIKKKLNSLKFMIKGGRFKLVCPPCSSMSNVEMGIVLDDMVLDGFVPDVIVVDFADIMKPERRDEHRHEINTVWKGLRSLAQDKYCGVFTATHSNRSTFKRDQKEADIVEDIRKINHVALMVALNQTNEEKRLGIMRASVLAHRDEEFNSDDSVVILQNLKIGKPYLDSKDFKKVKYNTEEE